MVTLRPGFRLPSRRARMAIVVAAALLLSLESPRAGTPSPARQSPAPSPAPDNTEPPLLARIRASLQTERQQLLAYAYRERRRALKVSALGKVSLGPEQIFDILPSADVDRPRRVLIAVDGRPATDDERREYAKRHPNPADETPAQRQQRMQREAELRRRAELRFEDAFRIFAFEAAGTDIVEGVSLKQVRITPRQQVEPRSDMGRWMKRFTGVAWVDERDAQLVRLRLVATDSISLGWGVVGRIAEGTTITYTRKPVAGGQWFPATLRFEARGRTLLFRAFDVDSTTEWFDYRPYAAASATVGPSRHRPHSSDIIR